MGRIFIILVVAMVPIGLYMYFFIKRIFATFNARVEKKSIKILIIAAAVCLVVMCINIFSVTAIIVLHIVVAAMAVQFVNFIVKKIAGEKYNALNIWKKLYGSGIIPLLISAVLLIWGYFNMMNVTETDYTIYTDKSIREEGYRTALIADIHFGVSVDIEELRQKCDEISGKNLDIVVLCGDIVDENTGKEDMEKVFEALGAIESTYGTYFVYGNHDRQPYSDNKLYTEKELENTISLAGITILSDETYTINNEFTIVGREDASITGDSGRKTISELLDNEDMDNFILVLDHKPTEYKENSEAGSDLILSGHTHAGQIWPANILFQIMKFDDAVYGYTKINDTQALVTSGFAGWGYPIKTSAPAEYVIIDIKSR
ncbi:MAG: metallophosphoesterase [Lachnospiraceae bacterium]